MSLFKNSHVFATCELTDGLERFTDIEHSRTLLLLQPTGRENAEGPGKEEVKYWQHKVKF